MLLSVMLMQAAVDPPPRFVLKPLLAPSTCGAATDDEILVCGDRGDRRYRLNVKLDHRYDDPARAETRLFGDAKASVETESAALAGGVTVPRLMVRLKIPF